MSAKTSSIILSTATSDIVFRGGGRARPLEIKRMAQARTMRLSVDPRDGGVRLVLPRRASMRDALRWAEAQRPWVERALDALPPARQIGHGATIEVEGEALTIEIVPKGLRGVRRDGDRLLVAGPEDMLVPRLLRWMRALAAAKLESETRRFAEKAGVTVGRVTVGDQRTRWGSCTGSGDIRYSWRLILAPPSVLEATVAHEVAHRLHMDHSPAFHAALRELLGRDPKAERNWLRANGVGLHWLGRDP